MDEKRILLAKVIGEYTVSLRKNKNIRQLRLARLRLLLFYTLATVHKISVKKVTKSFHMDVTKCRKSSIIILKCTIRYTNLGDI